MRPANVPTSGDFSVLSVGVAEPSFGVVDIAESGGELGSEIEGEVFSVIDGGDNCSAPALLTPENSRAVDAAATPINLTLRLRRVETGLFLRVANLFIFPPFRFLI